MSTEARRKSLGWPPDGPYDIGRDLEQSHMRFQTTSGGRTAQTDRKPAYDNQEDLRP
jgi:hypothetical protein